MGGAAAAVGLVAGLGGSLFQAKSALDTGDAQYQAGRTNAELALREGYAEERRRRTEGRQELSRERVAYARAGVALEGSPLELLARNAMALERDALDARLAGQRTAAVEKAQAKNLYRSSRKQSMASILSGVSGTAATGYKIS